MLGLWVRELRLGLWVFYLGKRCRNKKKKKLFSVWAKWCVLHVRGHHFISIEIMSFWGLFGNPKKKKKHIGKMTWQLTVETNRGGDLLMEPKVRV